MDWCTGHLQIPFSGSPSYRYVSATDVIRGTLGADELKDRIVLVGTSARGLRRRGERVRAQDPLVHCFEHGLLLGPGVPRFVGELEAAHLERGQLSQDVAAGARDRVQEQVEAHVARSVTWRQRIGAPAVTNDARSRHRLVAPAIDVRHVLAHAGRDVEVEVFREADSPRRPRAELEHSAGNSQ